MNRSECLEQATEAVNHSRNQVYGNPMQNFLDTAALWSTVLGIEITPAQVALCMAMVKAARLLNTPDHPDSWVDLAGYAACGAEVATTRWAVE